MSTGIAWGLIASRGNALLITNQTSGTAKIDPLMAPFNTAELMARAPEPKPRSFHDEPEPMRIAFGGSVHSEDADEDRGWRRVCGETRMARAIR